jgi:hypothetical protein
VREAISPIGQCNNPICGKRGKAAQGRREGLGKAVQRADGVGG